VPNPFYQTGFVAQQIGSFKAAQFVAPLTAATDTPDPHHALPPSTSPSAKSDSIHHQPSTSHEHRTPRIRIARRSKRERRYDGGSAPAYRLSEDREPSRRRTRKAGSQFS
jgi:hypothetical protein